MFIVGASFRVMPGGGLAGLEENAGFAAAVPGGSQAESARKNIFSLFEQDA
ncbi:MAG: hypothetical protein V1816_04840 [Pseudomonadota bacterium]